MKSTHISERVQELNALIREGDLSRSSRRMLDFFADVSLPQDLKRKAIALRSQFNIFSQIEPSQASEVEYNRLMDQAEDLFTSIERALPVEVEFALPHSKGQAIFKGVGITKTFRTAKFQFQLPRIDLQLKLGEITGVVGENGNGKTTLLRIVAGDLQADGGIITYPGFDAKVEDWYSIKQDIAYIPQALQSWKGFLKENLHFSAAIHGLKGRENEEQVDFMIHRLGLSHYEEALWSEISSGYKLRFELARALVWKPRLLIIDEPLANLDINTQQVFLQDLRYLANSATHPMAILLTSQHLHEVESIADNIIFMKNGEALYNGKMKDFGADRTENLFEISTDSPKIDLIKALQQLPGMKVEDAGQIKVIHVSKETSANIVLNKIVNYGIAVNYFRDISTSTLKLFREHVKKD